MSLRTRWYSATAVAGALLAVSCTDGPTVPQSDDAQAESVLLKKGGGGGGKPDRWPPASYEYRVLADDPGLKIVSDGRFDPDGDGWSMYEHGVCGVQGRIYKGGSGDTFLDPDMDWSGRTKRDPLCEGSPRTITVFFDDPADSLPPPVDIDEEFGIAIVLGNLWGIAEGETVYTWASLSAGRCLLKFNSDNYEGSDKVQATRLDATTWLVETQTYPDDRARCLAEERSYHMPFKIRVTAN